MEDIKKGLQTVVNKAWDDTQFRSDLVANPKSAIESATGLKVPADTSIVVNDQTDEDTIFLNIPAKPDFDNMELTDDQLEQVAGGEITTVVMITATVIATAWTVSNTANDVNNNRKKKGKKHW